MLLDTTFMIDMLRGDEAAKKKLMGLERNMEAQCIATPTIFELWRGIALSHLPLAHKRKVLETITSLSILSLDLESAKKAGEIDAELISRGEAIDPEDSMLAGIALVHGEKLLTRNVKHLSRISGLEVETY